MVEHCRNNPKLQWLGSVIVGLAFSGLRISKLASLRWSDINFEKGVVVLTDERRSRVRRRAGDFRTLKGKRSRQFPIHTELRQLLDSLPRQSDGLVFHEANGKRIIPNRVLRILVDKVIASLGKQYPNRLGEVVGFAQGRVHSLTHSPSSDWLRAKNDLQAGLIGTVLSQSTVPINRLPPNGCPATGCKRPSKWSGEAGLLSQRKATSRGNSRKW